MTHDAAPNVDPHEIAKFEAMAATWWDTEGEFKPLHQINPLRRDYVALHSGGVAGKKILDVGCGGGILAESLAKLGAEVTGLDMGEAPLTVARAHAKLEDLPIQYIQSPVEAHAQNYASQYDVVTCMEMLEHVPNPALVVTACAQLVKPGGQVFFSTLNRNVKSWLFAIAGAEHLLNIVPKGTHDYDKFIRPSELMQMIDPTPLIERRITGLHYNPLTQTYRLGHDVSVNYMLHTERPMD